MFFVQPNLHVEVRPDAPYFYGWTVIGDPTLRLTPVRDTAPPTTTVSISGVEGDNGWFTSDVTVSLSSTDDVSGVNVTEYSFDEATWTVYSTPFLVTNEGDVLVYYRSTDKAGNLEVTKTETIKIDKTAPKRVDLLRRLFLPWEE